MIEEKYRPEIAHDENYIGLVAGTIEKKAPLETIRFEYLNETLSALGIEEDPYAGITAGKFDSATIEKIAKLAFDKINSGALGKKEKESLYRMWNYLTEEDKPKPSELIFVFGGSGGEERAQEAAKLYNEGFSKKILFTGRHSAYMKGLDISEAEYCAKEAMRQGVPREDIILEKNAVNTPENVVNSAAILKEMKWLPKSIILITAAFHMRRAYLTFKSAADWQPKLTRHASQAEFGRENYFNDASGWNYVFFEYIKLYGARKMEHF